ncbi:MAG: DUF1638 domain-containing protein [Desulfobacterales bacterium]|nr:MAG: DUF1638 domain-containing protein [Desulfobacterales bacterium]
MSLPKDRPTVIIACRVLQSMLQQLLPAESAENAIFMDYGLHRQPGKMTRVLQEEIDKIEASSLILLGYGLCGKGLAGIKSGKHTLKIPRVDDCIAILLGSRQAYRQEFNAAPGTYYLSKGWLESGSHPLKEYEEYLEKYGAEKTAWIMDQQYQHYERLVLVGHSQSDLETYRPQALKVARYCERWDMRYEELLGSYEYVRRLIDASAVPDNNSEDFVIIPPGGEIRLEQFM